MSYLFCLLSMLLAAPPVEPPLRAEERATREYQLKAAFVYNFAQFTQWPQEAFQSSSSPIVLAVVGANPFGQALEQAVQGKRIDGRELVVRYFPDPDALSHCHVLFIPLSERDRTGVILAKLRQEPVLTIGETDDFTAAGGVIRFLVEENKIRFEINVEAGERAGLKLSSKLLRLARIYRQEG